MSCFHTALQDDQFFKITAINYITFFIFPDKGEKNGRVH